MSSCAYQSPWMTDDVRLFRKTVRQFIEEAFVPHQDRWREQQRPDAEAWTAAGRAGILLTDVPEEYEGGGGSFAHEAIVLEELVHAGVQFGSSIQSIVGHYVLAYGSEQQKRSWLPRRGTSSRRLRSSSPKTASCSWTNRASTGR